MHASELEALASSLCDAVAELGPEPGAEAVAGVLRLLLRFAPGPATAPAVLRAGGHWVAFAALQRWPAQPQAVALLSSLAAHHSALPAARAALFGPSRPPRAGGGSQRLTGRLRAAARRAERDADAGAGAATAITALHCGGGRFSLAAVRAMPALVPELTARCEAERRGAPPPPVCGARAQPLPAGDPRRRAGCGSGGGCRRGVFATSRLAPGHVVGAYAAWVTCDSELDARTSLLQRDSYQQRAVACSPAAPRLRSTGEGLLFVAHPPGRVADATAELNDWRARPQQQQTAEEEEEELGGGACGHNAALVEVVHRGWPHLFVVALAGVELGGEVAVEYPPEFWGHRAAAGKAQRAARAACGHGAAAVVAG